MALVCAMEGADIFELRTIDFIPFDYEVNSQSNQIDRTNTESFFDEDEDVEKKLMEYLNGIKKLVS